MCRLIQFNADECSQIAALGFDHLMVPADTLNEELLREATARGLKVVVECALDTARPDADIVQAHPAWRASSGTGSYQPPDPRRAPRAAHLSDLPVHETASRQAILGWWTQKLNHWATLGGHGIGGACVSLDGQAPAEFFTAIIAAVKQQHPLFRFFAWTPGISGDRVASMASVGFDAAFSSSAWWDFRADWLTEEAQRLRPFGALIGVADKAVFSHGNSALATPAADEGALQADAAVRARGLWLAVLTTDGVLVSGNDLTATAPALGAALRFHAYMQASPSAHWSRLHTPHADVTLLAATCSATPGERVVLITNTSGAGITLDIAAELSRFDGLAARQCVWPTGELPHLGVSTALAPAQTRVLTASPTQPTSQPAKDPKRLARAAAKAPRLVIDAITPCVDGGRFAAKRSVGELLVVEADIFGEGHDRLAAVVRWRAPADDRWQEVTMRALGNDRWRAELLLPHAGRYGVQVEAWIDVFGAYRDELGKKAAAGQQVKLELQEGALLLDAALVRASQTGEDAHQPLIRGLKSTLKKLATQRDQTAQVALLLGDDVLAWMVGVDERVFSVRSASVLQVDAERRAAGFASWYELFPRSMGLDARTHGTFDDVTARLPAIRAMGFDTLYFPPIHPIGRQHRKGPNNTLVAGPDDPGSPYAIGSAEGGHDAIHAELGTLADFRALRLAALDHGLELAIDFAIQCSPDHPWLKAHPDWFSWRPDGTIRYAENPPKKYQDIVNVDFYAPGAVPGLWMALRDVVLFWVKEGIKIFRVDNPHTKPMPFWEWLIGDVRGRFPDVIFLAEAFTRPKPMYQLAKLGFSQSYTYFTWRHSKQEFIDYLTELADGPPRDFFRPHFFVNTPDINPYFLQRSGRAGFVIRAALAATLSGLWGVYSGFELCESQPVPGGKEEYADSEKYQLRQRDWSQPGHIVREITLLNHARQTNPALQTHTGVRFCRSSGDQVLCFTKTATAASGAARNIVFVAICLDPHAAQACSVELPLEDWGLAEDAAIVCEDLVHGHTWTLHGRHHTLHLDPAMLAFTLWRLRPEGDN